VKTSSSIPPTLRFGVFELDPRAGEVRKKGMRIRLQGHPVEILVRLLERPGEIVTREELQKQLWPADTFVDFESGLNNAMKRLRAALDDHAENPRFIETLPRHGYRFVGSVDGAERIPPIVARDDGNDSAISSLPEGSKLQSELRLAFLYMRGQAHLVAHHGSDAAEDFQKIIDHRGIVPNLLLVALAHLGLARAYALDGDTGKSRAEYEEFFGFFEGADSEIPILQQAKMEYSKLR
jgi:DNA-binding winged helix-turn-helix (wHTH) protein